MTLPCRKPDVMRVLASAFVQADILVEAIMHILDEDPSTFSGHMLVGALPTPCACQRPNAMPAAIAVLGGFPANVGAARRALPAHKGRH